MTGGRVVVLGGTGRKFGAGMSGGIAYVLDPDGTFAQRVNLDMVALETLDVEDRRWLADILARHQSETGSAVAERLLASWGSAVEQFAKIMPRDYRRVLEATRAAVEEGRSVEDAVMASARG
jgi:glutamate synthase (NADPH) large chain